MFGEKPQELPQNFVFVMVPEFTMMPVTSAIEPLRLANRLAEKTLYKWTMHSEDGKPVAASNGILAMVDGDLDQVSGGVNPGADGILRALEGLTREARHASER